MASGEDVQTEQEWLNGGSFYDYYQSKDGRYFSVAGLEPAFVKNLASALDEPRLLNLINMQDKSVQKSLKTLLQQIFFTRSYDHWCELFASLDCCVEPLLTVNEAAEHPHMQARDMTLQYQSKNNTSIKQIACPIKFSHSQASRPTTAPVTGEHNEQVLKSLS